MMIDRLTVPDSFQNTAHLAASIVRHNHVDGSPKDFAGAPAQQTLCGRVPAGHYSVKRHRHDGIFGRLNGGAEQALAVRMAFELGFSAAMLS